MTLVLVVQAGADGAARTTFARSELFRFLARNVNALWAVHAGHSAEGPPVLIFAGCQNLLVRHPNDTQDLHKVHCQ